MADANPFDTSTAIPQANYEDGLLSWIDQRIKEGDAILKDEPAYDEIDKSISYIMGDQISRDRPSALANCPDNRLKNILNQTVAALTDIHPIFGFKTYNANFKDQEDVLMKLSQAWWVNTFADLRLGDVIKFSAGVGTGYCEVVWDASLYGGTGDILLRSLDPRDVLPIQPSLTSSVQDWGGLIIRTSKTPDELKVRFPDKAHLISADNQPSLISRTWSRARKAASRIITPAAVDVSNASNARNTPKKVATTEVYTTYVKDRRLCTSNQPIIMGDPLTTWSYTVYPVGWEQVPDGNDTSGFPQYRKADIEDSKLYPRGRMIISTKKTILYDGPNPYWHGMFPIAKLSLDPWPWSFLGLGLVHDIIPLQDALNETLNGFLDHVRKLLRPAVVADKKITATSNWEKIDTRMPGLKIKTPTALGGKAIEFVSPEALPPYTFEFLQWLATEMDYHAGTANLAALTQLQQTPGSDTIEKMQEALSPVLRLKGRLLECFLREIGEMVKGNFFQFYSMPRRVSMLGDAGVVFNDFDFDPGSLVPAMSEDDPDYDIHIDKSIPRAKRAQWFHKNFTFQITPNSLLAISQISRKLMYMMLRKDMLVDRWTLYDVMEIPNGGAPPPGTGEDITSRIMAEMQMMQALLPQPAPGPGQPSSMQEPPIAQEKTDPNGVPRTTISTSGTGGDNP